MAQVIIRNIDERIVRRLKQRAKGNGRSLEAELREILEKESHPKDPQEFKSALDEFHKRMVGRKHTDSVALLRKDRDR
jgi:plasmid stability protein